MFDTISSSNTPDLSPSAHAQLTLACSHSIESLLLTRQIFGGWVCSVVPLLRLLKK